MQFISYESRDWTWTQNLVREMPGSFLKYDVHEVIRIKIRKPAVGMKKDVLEMSEFPI